MNTLFHLLLWLALMAATLGAAALALPPPLLF